MMSELDTGNFAPLYKKTSGHPAKDSRQEIAEQAETFIKNILVDDMVPIGAHSEELKVNLLDFLKRKKVNVAAGLSEVMKQIDPEVAIRAKTGGFCYKSSFLSCPNDPYWLTAKSPWEIC